MADPRDVARGLARKGVRASDASPSTRPQRPAGSTPSAAPAAEPISDFERGLAARAPHFTFIPKVPLTGKAAAAALPGWSPAMADHDMTNAKGNASAVSKYAPPLATAVQARGVDMSAPLLAGWISQESSGKPYRVDPGRLDEIGLIQISRQERIDYLHSTEPGGNNDVRAKMLDQNRDRGAKAQLEYSAQLIAVYQGALDRAGMGANSPAMPKMIRFAHNLGLPKAAKLIRDIAASSAKGGGLNLGAASYNDVVKWAAVHGRSKGFLAAMRKSDYAALGGQKALDQAAALGN